MTDLCILQQRLIDEEEDYANSIGVNVNKKIGDASKLSPFADKSNLLFDGHGVENVCPVGETTHVDFVVSTIYKYDAIEIIGGEIGDRVALQILDDSEGTYTGTPNAVLNQFGTNWSISSSAVLKKLPYDAQLYPNMVICVAYENRTTEKTIYVNHDLHKVI